MKKLLLVICVVLGITCIGLLLYGEGQEVRNLRNQEKIEFLKEELQTIKDSIENLEKEQDSLQNNLSNQKKA